MATHEIEAYWGTVDCSLKRLYTLYLTFGSQILTAYHRTSLVFGVLTLTLSRLSHNILTLKSLKSSVQSSPILELSLAPKCRKASTPHSVTRYSSQHYRIASHHYRLRVTITHSDSLQLEYGTVIPGPAASISDLVLPSACLRPERNQGPSQCTRQTDTMAAGLKTIIALSFVCFDLSFLLSPPISIFDDLIPAN